MVRVKSIRVQRLEETIKEELSQLLHQKIKDPRIGFVTITDVDLSPDLRRAVIFITIM
ncbi:ribosome-binding factor A [Candidatus Hakubella thermalkaliphila]|nr:30S ribosome-binding factor RbfA [Candidatus Hakubella thermalkaliphila]GFP20523.1 ribosome-binding factor A [Candidatus Hakubella thermalkaliphila]